MSTGGSGSFGPGGGQRGFRTPADRASETGPVHVPEQVEVYEPPAPPFELSWFLALLCGFAGSLVGGLIGVIGAPVLCAMLAFLPLWLRVGRRSKISSSALAAIAWMIGCIGAGAGLGAEGSAARFANAVPLSRAYLLIAPLEHEGALVGWERWPSFVPAILLFWLVSGLGRFAQGLPSVFAAALPVAWIAARAARFTERALQADWDASTAFLLAAPPQHVMVLAGALAVAAVLGSPRGESGFPPAGTVERRVYLVGMVVGLTGILAEPWIDSLWRASAGI